MSIALDLINFTVVLLILLLTLIYLRLDALKASIILFHLVGIFFLNGVLFPASYFSDQFNYLGTTQLIRESFPVNAIKYHFIHMTPHYIAGTVFALFPLPFISSIYSLALINFLIYLFMIVYMRRRRLSNEYVDFFFLLYPSLMLYSSLALRETLILFFTFLVLYHLLIDTKYLLAFFYGIPLFLFKYQNFLMIITTIPLYLILRKASKIRFLLVLSFATMLLYLVDYIPLVNSVLEKVEYFRFNLFAENYGYNWELMEKYNYSELKRGFGLLIQAGLSSFYFLAKPFPWEVSNAFQLIQSVENAFLIGLLIFLNTKKGFIRPIRQKVLFLNAFLFVSSATYGLVVFNYGAIARYKFPILTIYFVFLLFFYRYDRFLRSRYPNYA